jgi:murein DD-endopeptidase MepM/ murein hydrolase activator NlpD
MGKKFYSIIVVPHSKKSFRRVTISEKTIKILMGISAALLIALVTFLVDYFSMSITRQKYKNLRQEVAKQNETLAAYENSIKQLKTTVDNFESYAKKLNVMAGLKSREVIKEVGVGGGSSNGEELTMSPPSAPQQNLSFSKIQDLSSKASDIESNLTTLVNFFENQSAKLATTPTIWPTVGWPSSGFGWRIDPFTGKQTFHFGIDIATSFGNPVVATADGIVVELKNDKISGKSIVLSHGGGVTTQYLHLSKFLVRAAQKVKRGDAIGLVGKTGKALGPHVHYEVRINDKAVNPYDYILEE